MDQEELKESKERLIESLGVHIERKDQLPPLAARIISTLVLTGKKGATFEELVVGLKASKSTISTHLNSLQNSKNITYYTICGDRKKYFIMNPDGLIINMDKMIATWEQEMQLHIQIMEYKQKTNQSNVVNDDLEFDLEFHNDFLNYLNQATTSIKNIRQKLASKTNQD
ncbi:MULTISPECIES: GbsR/MarR family transcriptional regulator [unclassified Leeuwenhoekiella]|uniref:GbsR/MarR family transcriptional regulator n=1 Tax=unclassified Leeuwenhoekiella TaxID=2615029 RepID=UPI00048D4C4E|nr:transcriptional regulator [Leeuwenhoekiella sp. MAR_2009_132]